MASSVNFFIVCSILLFFVTLYAVYYYALPSVSPVVKVTVYLSWFVSFSVCMFLPVDVLTPSGEELQTMWQTIYWSAFLVTWTIVPFQQSFFEASAFTLRGKLKFAIHENLKFYGLCGALLLGFLIYVAIVSKFDISEFLGFGICLSNTWGLTLAVLVLGYGLVEVPRRMWWLGHLELRMNHNFFKASQLSQEWAQTKHDIADTNELLAGMEARMDKTITNYSHFTIIKSEVPVVEDDTDFRTYSEPKSKQLSTKTDDASLVRLRAHVRVLRLRHMQQTAEWAAVVETAEKIDDLMKRSKDPPALIWTKSGLWTFITWWAVFRIRVMAARALAVLMIALSAVIVWCEMTILSGVNLSPLAVIVESIHFDLEKGFAPLAIVFSYFCGCAFFGMFQLKLAAYYRMQPGRRTDSNSLLFNAGYLLRLVFPLGFNFQALVRVQHTAFSKIMGQMELIPFLGTSFTKILPIIIVVFCLVTTFNGFGRVLAFLRIPHFSYRKAKDSDEVEEGKLILKREIRRKKARLEVELLSNEGTSARSSPSPRGYASLATPLQA